MFSGRSRPTALLGGQTVQVLALGHCLTGGGRGMILRASSHPLGTGVCCDAEPGGAASRMGTDRRWDFVGGASFLSIHSR